MKNKARVLLERLDLQEKAALGSGADFWSTKAYPEKGVPSITMSDGPHGLRKQKKGPDNLGINESEPATCFPAACAMANSWNRDLLKRVGKALGEECLEQGVSVLLGPGINIKRSPLCGRNFEYFSEDPYLAGQLGGSLVNGVQSTGVGCAVKHFAVNNQETSRMTVNAVLSRRALHEIYLAPFEHIVKTERPWLLMSAYNKVNGEYCSESPYLLNDVLRNKWGYEGAVVSDWGAVNHRVSGVGCGMDLEMPYNGAENDDMVANAVKSGSLAAEALDKSAERMLEIALKGSENKRGGYKCDYGAHNKLAAEAAAESMVLLKNESNTLPFMKKGDLAVIGEFASKLKIQGAGSSRVNPISCNNIFEELAGIAGSDVGITYSQGYSFDMDDIDAKMVEDALETAKDCENILVIAGIPDRVESEGFDRKSMALPYNQNYLIERLTRLGRKITVVLLHGSPVEMPWIDKIDALICAYMGGQAMAAALARIIFGDISPSGRLAESYPYYLENNPSFHSFPGDSEVHYSEDVFVGYRFYASRKIKPMFPFGYGLSYSGFKYSALRADKKRISDKESVSISLTVKNTGSCTAKETVQIYVQDIISSVPRPLIELKAFEKIELLPGESKSLSFILDKSAFAYYNPDIDDWYVESGEFIIHAGFSSESLPLNIKVYVDSTQEIKKLYDEWSTVAQVMDHPAGKQIMEQLLSGAPGGGEHYGVDMLDLVSAFPLKKLLGHDGKEALQGILSALNS